MPSGRNEYHMSILTCIIIAIIGICIGLVITGIGQWFGQTRFEALVAKRNASEEAEAEEAAEEAAAKDRAAEEEEAVEEEKAVIFTQAFYQDQCNQIRENERRAKEHAAWVVDQKARAAWPELKVGKDTAAQDAEWLAWTKARMYNQ